MTKKLQTIYNEWRKEIEEHNKLEKEIGGSLPTYGAYDSGEQAAREDFTEYAELEKEITFEEMQALEQNY